VDPHTLVLKKNVSQPDERNAIPHGGTCTR
jgi:hypothetical protein